MLDILLLSITLFGQTVRCYNIPHFITIITVKEHQGLVNSNKRVEAAAETFKESTMEYGCSDGPSLSIATVKSAVDIRWGETPFPYEPKMSKMLDIFYIFRIYLI